MVLLSTLRPAGQGCKAVVLPAVGRLLQKTPIVKTNIVRSMGGHGPRKFVIMPSKFEVTKWKDQWHFYTMLGVLPLALLVAYCNLFIGQAELVEIPEDYEPRHWEYYKHPISRFIARYMMYSPEFRYEQKLSAVLDQQNKRDARLLEKKVNALMTTRGDYKGPFYRDTHPEKVFVTYERQRRSEELGESSSSLD